MDLQTGGVLIILANLASIFSMEFLLVYEKAVPKFDQNLKNHSNVRPLSDDEQKVNVSRAVSCNQHKREVTVLQILANNKQVDRVFTFDKVWFLFYYNYII